METLSITKKMQFINKKIFAKIVLNENSDTFDSVGNGNVNLFFLNNLDSYIAIV